MSGKRPPNIMSDDERALFGAGRRTPAHGVPMRPEDRDDFTPVTDLLDSIEDPEQRRMFRLLWEHTANQEMRYQRRIEQGDAALVRSALDEHREECLTFKVDLVGKDGGNGKIGEIRKGLATMTSRALKLVSIAIGAAGAAIVKLVIVARAYGDLETEVTALRDRVQLLESVAFLRNRIAPAFSPGKANEHDPSSP